MDDNSVIEDSDRLSYCSNTSSSSFHLNYSVNSFTENENLGIVQRRRKQFEEMANKVNHKSNNPECDECCKGVLKSDGAWIKENIEEEGSVSEISDINDEDVVDHSVMNESETKNFFYGEENEIEHITDERAVSFYEKFVDKKPDNKTTSDIKFNRNSGLSSNESEEYFRYIVK